VVAPGFEEVASEFAHNFEGRGELGAAVSVFWRGELVVDLWGGFRDPACSLPWQEDTLVMLFSMTKGIAAVALAMAHARGWLDYDAPVARYWPEFAAADKDALTVRQLIDHEGGLVLIDQRLDMLRLGNLDALATVLARQQPIWKPGSRHGYHTWTMGLYMNELLRRVDPRHRSLGPFLRDEIAGPLGLELYIGLPAFIPQSRLAVIEMLTFLRAVLNSWKVPPGERREILRPNSLLNQALALPTGMDPNDRKALSVEFPGLNGVGTARAVAAIYSELVTGAKRLGLTAETLSLLSAAPVDPPAGPRDEVLGIDTWFSYGFEKPPPDLEFGSSRRAFGHSGAGGSFGYADPDRCLAYAYVMNRLDFYGHGDPREKALRSAVERCVARLSTP
jgi:CubicO group peptidase (beta-lactamase class C family)